MTSPSFNLVDTNTWQNLKSDGDVSVYLAESSEGTPIIVKQLRCERIAQKLSVWLRSKRLARLNREKLECLPEYFGTRKGELPDSYLFLYQAISGDDLRKLDWSSLSMDQSILLAEEIAKQLLCLHDSGWVHGDFKFGNLLFNQDRAVPKITIVDLESIRNKDTLNSRSRDLARFLLNAIEKNVPELVLQAFWNFYHRDRSAEDSDSYRYLVKKQLVKLAKRHEEKYQKNINTSLVFL